MTEPSCSPDKKLAPVIGLLGAVASGKTTVARLLAERGAAVVDADQVAHELLKEPRVKAALRQAFGDEIFAPCGEVDRTRLGELVFDQPDRLRKLNAVVHPEICRRADRQVTEQRRRPGVAMVVLDAALLLEKGLDSCCDLLVFVETDSAARRERAQTDRGWNPGHLASRDAAQMSLEAKRTRADYVLGNDGRPDELGKAVDKMMQKMEERFGCLKR